MNKQRQRIEYIDLNDKPRGYLLMSHEVEPLLERVEAIGLGAIERFVGKPMKKATVILELLSEDWITEMYDN